MIQNKNDLQYYLKRDQIADDFIGNRPKIIGGWPNVIWKYKIFLRKAEYYKNKVNEDGTIDRSLTTDPNEAESIPFKSVNPKVSGGLTNILNYKKFHCKSAINHKNNKRKNTSYLPSIPINSI